MTLTARTIYTLLAGATFTLCLVNSPAHAADSVSVLPAIPAKGGIRWYGGNRDHLQPSPLIKLPVGRVEPRGWLRAQLTAMADGFTGHLTEISKWCNYDSSAWVNPHGIGKYGWEEMPYWLRGFTDLGYVLGDKRIIAEAERWIDGIIATQDSSGYFGPRPNEAHSDIWPNMIVLYALRTHYEATHDERVVKLMTLYFRWLMTIPLEQYLPGSWQKIRGGDNLDHIYWLYNNTGDPWLLDLARINHERTADWTGGIPSWHGVNICQSFREPAEYYQQTRDRRYLQATLRNYDSVMSTYGQVPGGMFGADEEARSGYTGPRQAAESCSMVEFMHSDEMLAGITGDPVWADRCEDVAFNSLPAAMTSTLKGLHYLTAPNMVQLDSAGKAPMIENDGEMLSYNPWQYRCCQHNVSFGWPYFAEHLWCASSDRGLAAVLYAPSRVMATAGDGEEVNIVESTEYPFRETVNLQISVGGPVSFPLYLRIPGWCGKPELHLNGARLSLPASPQGWIRVERTWQDGDKITLRMPMDIKVRVWHQNHDAVSVDRGPLTYSLKIGERWQRYTGSDTWPGFEVFPTTPWNYGLLVDTAHPSKSFRVVERKFDKEGQPFDPANAPIELHARGKRIAAWKQEANGLIGKLQESPARSDESVDSITLIPMGCARLRVSAFPVIGDGTDAHDWK